MTASINDSAYYQITLRYQSNITLPDCLVCAYKHQSCPFVPLSIYPSVCMSVCLSPTGS